MLAQSLRVNGGFLRLFGADDMKIDNGAGYLFAHRAQNTNPAARADKATSFGATLAGKTSETSTVETGRAGVKQADFTNMTRQEMRDWTNQEIKSGNMTLDESAPLMFMTMKVPVGGGHDVPAAGDGERIDFTNRARLGIEGALSRKDSDAAKRLQVTLDIMLKNQGQTVGVDTRA